MSAAEEWLVTGCGVGDNSGRQGKNRTIGKVAAATAAADKLITTLV